MKDQLSFYQLDDDNQPLLKQESSKFHTWSVGVRYGRPVTLLDAANCAKDKRDKGINYTTIRNAFMKADLRISLDSAVKETFKNIEFLKLFKNFNITSTEEHINKFVAVK